MQISKTKLATAISLIGSVFLSQSVFADNDRYDNYRYPRTRSYQITVTDITRGEWVAPRLIAIHKPGVSLFNLGSAASPEIADLAQNGQTAGLDSLLHRDKRLVSTETSTSGMIAPGGSDSITLTTPNKSLNFSIASMMVPSNDAFMAIQDMPLPEEGSVTYLVPIYDAGSEVNDETCTNAAGPTLTSECAPGQASNGSPGAGEGFVHIHAGIHGVGQLKPAAHDWRNPALKVTVSRTK